MIRQIRSLFTLLCVAGSLIFTAPIPHKASHRFALKSTDTQAKYLVLMIGDGQGINQIQAASKYAGAPLSYQSWSTYWVSTYSAQGNYDGSQAWSNFNYVKQNPTDSAAAATALSTGEKTNNGRISVSVDGSMRLESIADKARQAGKAVGAVTSVPISHATPGAWLAHNDSRSNGYAIADEALWGDPNTTGSLAEAWYGGGHGANMPPADVLIGGGHPAWQANQYVNTIIRDKLYVESGSPGAFTFVERIGGSPDGGSRLINASNDPAVLRLAGLFGGTEGNLDYRLADGSGYHPENPTLGEMTSAALAVLSRDADGFVLMVEGGAIDWAGHANQMDKMIGEALDFNSAVQTVIDWIDYPSNSSTWDNTLVIVTADHETGYLTAAPGEFPDQPLGEIDSTTLAYERQIAGSSYRASWKDNDSDNMIDPGEQVYWAWNSTGHTNSLVPLFVKGAGADLFSYYLTAGSDPIRGIYLDNTCVASVMEMAVFGGLQLPYRVYLPVTIK